MDCLLISTKVVDPLSYSIPTAVEFHSSSTSERESSPSSTSSTVEESSSSLLEDTEHSDFDDDDLLYDREDEDDELEDEEEARVPQSSPILSSDVEVMANVLSFLPPSEALNVLSAPVCKDWQDHFTFQPELWRILCLQDPFAAQMEDDSEDDDDDASSIDFDDDDSLDMEHEIKRTFGSHRLMFSRFVRCQNYITRIKQDALAGRPPSMIEYVTNEKKSSSELQRFLARARHSSASTPKTPPSLPSPSAASAPFCTEPISLADDGKSRKRQGLEDEEELKVDPKKPRFGASALTQRLLGATNAAEPAHAMLPWSCAIYSIVNWMIAYQNALGIQTLCLDALPCLMEDEQQRLVAQRAGLTDIVLSAMVRFPHSVKLQTAALHSIVLLARPIGGREGQLFSLSMTNSSNIFAGSHRHGGIEVVLNSMKRFPQEESLQAMGCWSLVNLALAPDQKDLLIQLGGISAILSSMTAHPLSTEVQFRALFSLINLVIPSPAASMGWLNPVVDRMVDLVVTSMKNFCSNVTILNRACLVLHNLSLTQDNHSAMLLDADCYHLLEWCIASYPTDAVLQQSATATLQRLQTTLSGNEHLRTRFAARQAERKPALEELLLPEDELWISDSDEESEEE